MMGKLQQGDIDQKGILLYIALCIVLYIFQSCWHVVFGCFQLTCPIVPV
jgi:hypothetical protein